MPQAKGTGQLPGEAGGRAGLGRKRGAVAKGKGGGGGCNQGFREERGTPHCPGAEEEAGGHPGSAVSLFTWGTPELEGCRRKRLTPAGPAMAGAPPRTPALPALRLRPSPTARGQTEPMGAESLPAAP